MEETEGVHVVFRPLERSAKLREALDGCVVFEYPTLFVVLPK